MPAWSEETVDILRQRAEALSREVSGQITIIGHSIGAVFGWSIARRIPQVVRHLVVHMRAPMPLSRWAPVGHRQRMMDQSDG